MPTAHSQAAPATPRPEHEETSGLQNGNPRLPSEDQPIVGRSKKRWLLAAILILAALALGPPLVTLNSFRNRLEGAMTAEVGRKVTVKDVRLRLLPQPGFDLAHFAIQDDAAFGSEPLLRSEQVTARLRLSSLWRGRIEISRLSLQEASLNLVRGADGHWNVEALLTRAAQIPSAPTASRHAEARPRFPYIEAEGGRINFKVGDEKKVYALTAADFGLWLASENEWETRLAARPVRTDADLRDTGILKISGRFQRAASLRDTPLRFNASWERGQLGQLTHLIYGRDRGWRGTIDAQLSLSGSPAELHGAGKIAVIDFRRYDIVSSDSFSAQIRCDGILGVNRQESSTDEDSALAAGQRILRGSCTLPSGKGIINATGYYLPGAAAGSVNLMAASFPLSTVVFLAKHMKRGIAEDLSAEGTLNGRIALHKGKVPPEPGAMVQNGRESWTLIANPAVRSKLLPAMNMDVLVFNFEEPAFQPGSASTRRKQGPDVQAQLTLLPARLFLGGATPALLSASANRSGYEVTLQGETEGEVLQNFFQALGLPPAPDANPTQVIRTDSTTRARKTEVTVGRERVNLQVSGSWSGFEAPLVSGTVLPEASPALARRKVQ